MKHLTIFASVLFLAALILPATPANCDARGTNQTSELFYGQTTNGVRGEIEVISLQDQEKLTEIIVWVNHLDDTNFVPPPVLGLHDMMKRCDYYMPTNSFCGPVELRDAAGRKLPLLKPKVAVYKGRELLFSPEVSSLAPYPKTYSLQNEHAAYINQFLFYSGPGIFPLPVFLSSTRTEMVSFQIRDSSEAKDLPPVPSLYDRRFQLRDYFDIKEAGEYKLTVWPKIYKRSSTNSDICVRIDLPPVTATFKLLGSPPK